MQQVAVQITTSIKNTLSCQLPRKEQCFLREMTNLRNCVHQTSPNGISFFVQGHIHIFAVQSEISHGPGNQGQTPTDRTKNIQMAPRVFVVFPAA
jgi:hypothetical protein